MERGLGLEKGGGALPGHAGADGPLSGREAVPATPGVTLGEPLPKSSSASLMPIALNVCNVAVSSSIAARSVTSSVILGMVEVFTID